MGGGRGGQLLLPAAGMKPTRCYSPSMFADENEIHIWIFPTDVSGARCAELRALLSPEELVRADRFVAEIDRVRFIASHGVMRIQLASYCSAQPQSLAFGAGPQGKPYLQQPASPLHFNLSHSGNRAALAVTRGARCGVDIQKVRPVADREIAERFFCANETRWLKSLPSGERNHGLFRLWSVKESILKASGTGMRQPLSSVDASKVLENGPQRGTLLESGNAASFWVQELDVAEGYTCAIAVEGNNPGIRVSQLEG